MERLTREEAAAIEAATPEGRRLAWIAAGEGRVIVASGNDWVARERGRVIARKPRTLENLMNELDRMEAHP